MASAFDFESVTQDDYEDFNFLDDEDLYSQSFPANEQRYQWQLNDGYQWLNINNDRVIETHYCQPGAKGMLLITRDYGRMYINFDKMEVHGSQLKVRRQTFLSSDEKQEIVWYYNDNRRWHEYGSQGSSSSKASVNSSDVEQQYSANPQGNIHFTVGRFSYSIDFRGMTQTNLTTNMRRRVRRRPKFNSFLKINNLQGSFQLPPVLQTAPPGGGGWKWQFLGDEGVWTDYSSTSCSMGSDDIERWYQSNPQGQVTFTGKFRYTLDFTGMLQTNNDTGTQRPVKRIQAVGQPTYQSSLFNSLLPLATPPVMPPSLPPPADCTWEFMGDEGVWTEYQTPSCTLDSKEIERLYQLNPQGQISFTAGMNSYTLNFARMCQTNDRFGTRRAVKRTQNGSTQLNSSSGYYSSQCRWQFKDVDGTWRDYTKGHCSVSSQDIENSYQQNPNGTMNFSTGSFQYVLDFSAMTQRNQSTLTTRQTRRLQQ